jgi:peptide/histidine transporter 3/4
MWIMWVGSMLATMSSVVAQLVDSYASINKKVTAAILVLQTIGFAGYQANIYQFGVDQLLDASTDAIKSFISWFIWTYFTSGIAGHYIYGRIDKQYHVVGQCFISICLTIALATSFLLNGILIKEPVVQNPYKLAYKVIKYALKNKHPQRRSAFTYCEDELPSRLDFGKSKYGGPFTTEQVEDVKTFLRVLVFTTFCSLVPGEAFIIYRHSYQLVHRIGLHGNTTSECFVRIVVSDLYF